VPRLNEKKKTKKRGGKGKQAAAGTASGGKALSASDGKRVAPFYVQERKSSLDRKDKTPGGGLGWTGEK